MHVVQEGCLPASRKKKGQKRWQEQGTTKTAARELPERDTIRVFKGISESRGNGWAEVLA